MDLAARCACRHLVDRKWPSHEVGERSQAAAGALEDRTHPDFSPVYAEPAGLPPVLIVVGADDVLLQDNLAMGARLSAAGVDVDVRVFPASPHGFSGHPTPMARAAVCCSMVSVPSSGQNCFG